ncbi:Uncharacterised protein [Bordetella pertussis]|nr:Uncharacterised protein [Bordetella pertussis]CFP66722.1 Uncharacterised protein [Bordetella pertussis]CFW13123.1 Uncharacterised protein [Bordetella pertussis]CFW43036.1 Uncharacterised protein [Bordetella pertussis]
MPWYSASGTPSSSAISPSLGARINSCSLRWMAVSMRRLLLRTLRGSQSWLRSSSSMAPRMRAVA